MLNMSRLVLAFSVLSPLFLACSAQTCNNHTFSDNKVFATCRDLPHLNSFLHWTYNRSRGQLNMAYRHSGITSTDGWVSWAINPSNSLSAAMIGAQALVAIPQSSGTPKVYTSSISSYATVLQEGNITYPHTGLTATYQNNEITIFATLTLPTGTTNLVHLWQDGPISGSTPQAHDQNSANLNAKETLDLVSAT